MARLTAPNGAVVNVTDDKATSLLARGYTTAKQAQAEEAKAKKPSPSHKTSEK